MSAGSFRAYLVVAFHVLLPEGTHLRCNLRGGGPAKGAGHVLVLALGDPCATALAWLERSLAQGHPVRLHSEGACTGDMNGEAIASLPRGPAFDPLADSSFKGHASTR
jgi:hypothetical protein